MLVGMEVSARSKQTKAHKRGKFSKGSRKACCQTFQGCARETNCQVCYRRKLQQLTAQSAILYGSFVSVGTKLPLTRAKWTQHDANPCHFVLVVLQTEPLFLGRVAWLKNVESSLFKLSDKASELVGAVTRLNDLYNWFVIFANICSKYTYTQMGGFVGTSVRDTWKWASCSHKTVFRMNLPSGQNIRKPPMTILQRTTDCQLPYNSKTLCCSVKLKHVNRFSNTAFLRDIATCQKAAQTAELGFPRLDFELGRGQAATLRGISRVKHLLQLLG